MLTFLLLKKPTRFGGSIKALAQALCNGHTIHIYLEELLVSVRLTDQIFQISTSDKSQHHDGHDYPRKEETESNPTGKTNKQEKKKVNSIGSYSLFPELTHSTYSTYKTT